MYPQPPNNTKQKITAGAVVLAAVALIVVADSMNNKGGSAISAATTATANSTSSTSSPQVSQTPESSTPQITPSSDYKDGTYSATSDYYVPHGYENIKVTITVKGGIVTDSSTANSETNRESAAYQRAFDAEYKSQVVGKPISDLQLSYVAGASDTTKGFDDALDKIRSEAKA